MTESRRVSVIGAGPVGCLAAALFAKRGWEVNVWEVRPGESKSCGRMIRLVSTRRRVRYHHYYYSSDLKRPCRACCCCSRDDLNFL
jgi:glycine/D-amino acid oxidase-like deaminating enzyme